MVDITAGILTLTKILHRSHTEPSGGDGEKKNPSFVVLFFGKYFEVNNHVSLVAFV